MCILSTGRNLKFNLQLVVLNPFYCGYTGADPGFLERRFRYLKVWGFALLILPNSLKYPRKMKQFGETKLFHFHRIFKNEGPRGGSSEPPLDPPL